MSIYDDHAGEAIEGVMHPVTRVMMGVPASLKSRYWREGVGFVLGADWDALRPLSDFETVPIVTESPAARQRRRWREYHARVAEWERAIYATEWGRDPMWRVPKPIMDAGGPSIDPRSGASIWHQARLFLKYGTTSLVDYAASKGLPYPPSPNDLT